MKIVSNIIQVVLCITSIITAVVLVHGCRTVNTVEHQLSFSQVRVIPTIHDERLKGIKLGFEMKNSSAIFPIHVEITEIKTIAYPKLGKNQFIFYPPKRDHEKTEFIVPPNGVTPFDDHEISIPTVYFDGITGEIRCKLIYGKKNDLKYLVEIKRRIHLPIMDKGFEGLKTRYEEELP